MAKNVNVLLFKQLLIFKFQLKQRLPSHNDNMSLFSYVIFLFFNRHWYPVLVLPKLKNDVWPLIHHQKCFTLNDVRLYVPIPVALEWTLTSLHG